MLARSLVFQKITHTKATRAGKISVYFRRFWSWFQPDALPPKKGVHAYRIQDQSRPADAIGCVVPVAKIATGEQSETVEKPRPYLTVPLWESRAVVQINKITPCLSTYFIRWIFIIGYRYVWISEASGHSIYAYAGWRIVDAVHQPDLPDDLWRKNTCSRCVRFCTAYYDPHMRRVRQDLVVMSIPSKKRSVLSPAWNA